MSNKTIEDLMNDVMYDVLYNKMQEEVENAYNTVKDTKQLEPEIFVVRALNDTILLQGTQVQCMEYWMNNIDKDYQVYSMMLDMNGNYNIDRLIIS